MWTPRAAVRGRFVTFEGPEGSGKTTQARRLAAAVRAAGQPVTLTREPGGTVLGERIRDLLLATGTDDPGGDPSDHGPLADALLFNAARAQLVTDVIGPALADGSHVVCARFADSTLAYQGHGAGLSLADLRALERVATGGLRPDLTILLDVPVEVGLGRKSVAGETTRFEESFDRAFHERVRAGFLELAAAEPDRFAVVDAAIDERSVWAAVLEAVARLPGWDRLRESEPETPTLRRQR